MEVDSTDILAVLSSFVPAGGAIESVAVHATKEGHEILEKEKVRGPQGLFQEEEEEDEVERLERLARGEEFEEEGEEIDQDALRAYQKKKMGYHVAIVRCNSVETAISLYSQCDGLEFERSSNVLDLRWPRYPNPNPIAVKITGLLLLTFVSRCNLATILPCATISPCPCARYVAPSYLKKLMPEPRDSSEDVPMDYEATL